MVRAGLGLAWFWGRRDFSQQGALSPAWDSIFCQLSDVLFYLGTQLNGIWGDDLVPEF